MTTIELFRSSMLCAVGLSCLATADAQNVVADWDANTLTAVVTTAKKAPAVAPVYFAYIAVAIAASTSGLPLPGTMSHEMKLWRQLVTFVFEETQHEPS